MTIGNKILALIKKRGFSLEEFCSKNKLSHKEVLEGLGNNNPDYKVMISLIKSFHDLDFNNLFSPVFGRIYSDIERLNILFDYLKISKNALGVKIGSANGMRFQNIYAGRNKISFSLAKSITNIYPEINYRWLLTGEGEMLKKDLSVINITEYEILCKRVEELENKHNKLKDDFQTLMKRVILMKDKLNRK